MVLYLNAALNQLVTQQTRPVEPVDVNMIVGLGKACVPFANFPDGWNMVSRKNVVVSKNRGPFFAASVGLSYQVQILLGGVLTSFCIIVLIAKNIRPFFRRDALEIIHALGAG